MKLNKNIIVVGVLVLLVVISAVQTSQVLKMKGEISEIETTGASIQKTTISSSKVSSSSGSGEVPTNLQNLPGMVGGC